MNKSFVILLKLQDDDIYEIITFYKEGVIK